MSTQAKKAAKKVAKSQKSPSESSVEAPAEVQPVAPIPETISDTPIREAESLPVEDKSEAVADLSLRQVQSTIAEDLSNVATPAVAPPEPGEIAAGATMWTTLCENPTTHVLAITSNRLLVAVAGCGVVEIQNAKLEGGRIVKF